MISSLRTGCRTGYNGVLRAECAPLLARRRHPPRRAREQAAEDRGDDQRPLLCPGRGRRSNRGRRRLSGLYELRGAGHSHQPRDRSPRQGRREEARQRVSEPLDEFGIDDDSSLADTAYGFCLPEIRTHALRCLSTRPRPTGCHRSSRRRRRCSARTRTPRTRRTPGDSEDAPQEPLLFRLPGQIATSWIRHSATAAGCPHRPDPQAPARSSPHSSARRRPDSPRRDGSRSHRNRRLDASEVPSRSSWARRIVVCHLSSQHGCGCSARASSSRHRKQRWESSARRSLHRGRCQRPR